jgi:hypothetical protein
MAKSGVLKGGDLAERVSRVVLGRWASRLENIDRDKLVRDALFLQYEANCAHSSLSISGAHGPHKAHTSPRRTPPASIFNRRGEGHLAVCGQVRGREPASERIEDRLSPKPSRGVLHPGIVIRHVTAPRSAPSMSFDSRQCCSRPGCSASSPAPANPNDHGLSLLRARSRPPIAGPAAPPRADSDRWSRATPSAAKASRPEERSQRNSRPRARPRCPGPAWPPSNSTRRLRSQLGDELFRV